jgi:hypothetical protein
MYSNNYNNLFMKQEKIETKDKGKFANIRKRLSIINLERNSIQNKTLNV